MERSVMRPARETGAEQSAGHRARLLGEQPPAHERNEALERRTRERWTDDFQNLGKCAKPAFGHVALPRLLQQPRTRATWLLDLADD
ncbi:hypothetical protein DB32_008956 [Sandaracinus amylolyticus]|uniref:Uncharacterized protein n=1 Tax=Sandaracinus amylolyticus TaxID=927083 RepID=A0A0F6YEU5_9BACT|nr:hypothetical protein DB32_000008 [Sandaracinus amylolyticus]AKF11807.1 hypothetical protein DB32_008956 [Sandaracinus amylolyticus]